MEVRIWLTGQIPNASTEFRGSALNLPPIPTSVVVCIPSHIRGGASSIRPAAWNTARDEEKAPMLYIDAR